MDATSALAQAQCLGVGLRRSLRSASPGSAHKQEGERADNRDGHNHQCPDGARRLRYVAAPKTSERYDQGYQPGNDQERIEK